MRARLAYPGCFLALLLGAAVIQWPAAALAPWLEQASGGLWRLAAAEGSIWRGAGMLLVRSSGNGPWRNAQSIRWTVLGRELWLGRVAIDLALEQGALRLVATPEGLAAENFDATLPAGGIGALLPGALGRYDWTGILRAKGAKFACTWGARQCNGAAELLWNDMTVTEISGPPLGDYQLRLFGEGPTLRINLATLRGRMQLTGHGELAAGGKLNFSGEAWTADGQESLNNLLGTLGRPAGGGKYRIEYRETGASR